MQQGSWQTQKGAVLSRLVPIRRQMQRNNQPQETLTAATWNPLQNRGNLGNQVRRKINFWKKLDFNILLLLGIKYEQVLLLVVCCFG
jgi:hypothetical protein